MIDLCGVNDIPAMGSRVVRVNDVEVALFRTSAGRVHAVENRCPHRGGPLSEGIVHGDAVTCPLHALTIALDTGEVCGPDPGCVRRFEVVRMGDRIGLREGVRAA